jgi:hypothetical protein
MKASHDQGGRAFAGIVMLMLGLLTLWKARSGFLYHTPIYSRGASVMDPWQAVVAGSLCLAFGVYILVTGAIRRRSRERDND